MKKHILVILFFTFIYNSSSAHADACDNLSVKVMGIQMTLEGFKVFCDDYRKKTDELATMQSSVIDLNEKIKILEESNSDLMSELKGLTNNLIIANDRIEFKKTIVFREGIKIFDNHGLKIYDDSSPSYFVIAPQGDTVLKSFTAINDESRVNIQRLIQ